MKISTSTEPVSGAVPEVRNLASVRPRIAYLVSLFPCWSETFIAEEIQELVNQGFDITIISLRPACEPHVHELSLNLLSRTLYADSYPSILIAQFYFLWKEPRIYLERFWQVLKCSGGKPVELLKLLATFSLAVHFARMAEKIRVGRIHAHWATYPATAAWIIQALTGINYSFTTHAHDLFLADRLLLEKCERASFIIAISNYNRQFLKELGVDVGKVHVIHCGVDTGKFTPLDSPRRRKGLILSVGRLVPIKGFEVLLEACCLLVEQKVDFSCEVVGDGPLLQRLQQQIDRSGIGHCVRLCGFLPHEQVKEKLAESALFVLPSRRTESGDQDGIPVALMEAMAIGVPVVSTSVSGIPELVQDEVNGILVPPGDPERLAEAIAELLRDDEKRAQLARRGRETVLSEFDVAKNAKCIGHMLAGPT